MEINVKTFAALAMCWIGLGFVSPSSFAEVSEDPGEIGGTWVTVRSGKIPEGSLKAGAVNGSELYICRGYYKAGLHPGQISTSDRRCLIVYNEAEVALDEYEILLEDPSLQWESAGLGWVSQQTVKAGVHDGDLSAYICRFNQGGVVRLGRLIRSSRWCMASGNSQVQRAYKYDILIVK
jgi:hypothetical protein